MQTESDSFEDALLAVLIWDVPSIYRANRQDARNFLNVLTLGGAYAGQPPDTDKSPIATAAAGLSSEIEGNLDEARTMYSDLIASSSLYVRILGKSLLLWSPAGNEAQIEDLLADISVESDIELRALLHFKVLTICLAQRWHEATVTVFNKCEALSPALPNPYQRRISMFGFNELGRSLEFDAGSSANGDGTLARYEYVLEQPFVSDDVNRIWERDQERKFQLLTDSPFQNRSFFGRSRSGSLLAIDQQLVWSGRFWSLLSERQHLGHALLTDDSASAETASYGAELYISGKGSSIDEAITVAEESMWASGAQKDWHALTQIAPPWRTRQRHQIISATWDLLSDTEVTAELSTLPPLSDVKYDRSEVESALWALGRRDTSGLMRYLRRQTPVARAAAFERSLPAYLGALNEQDRAEIQRMMFEALVLAKHESGDSLLLRSIVELPGGWDAAFNAGVRLPSWLAADVTPEAAAQVVDRHAFEAWQQQCWAELLSGMTQTIAEGQRGGYSETGVDAFFAFGRLSVLLGDSSAQEAFEKLATFAASSAWLNRYQVLRAMNLIVSETFVTLPDHVESQLEELNLDAPGTQWTSLLDAERPGEIAALQSSMILLASAHSDRVAATFAALLSATKSRESRVRLRAFGSMATALERSRLQGEDAIVGATALHSGLFDPNEQIVRFCAHRSALIYAAVGALGVALSGRLTQLRETRGRATRATAVASARLLLQGFGSSALSDLVDAARNDPSWFVRNEATREILDD